MAIEARIRELGSRHQTLEKVIEEEARLPSTDSLRLKTLKIQKLKLKEQMDALRAAGAH